MSQGGCPLVNFRLEYHLRILPSLVQNHGGLGDAVAWTSRRRLPTHTRTSFPNYGHQQQCSPSLNTVFPLEIIMALFAATEAQKETCLAQVKEFLASPSTTLPWTPGCGFTRTYQSSILATAMLLT